MTIKDILVHLDAGERDFARLDLGLALARRFGARLTGLFARQERYGPSLVARRESTNLAELAEATEAAFATATEHSGVECRFWRVSHGEPGNLLSQLVICARFADLVILGQPQGDDQVPSDMVERVLLQSGRPCLIVPAVGTFANVGTNVLVAWNGGRESTRALHDAMPLIQGAEVEVVTIRPSGAAPDPGSVPPVNVRDHLAAHGLTVLREQLAGDDIGVMDLLLSRAFDLGANLLVMGAYGGYHLPFLKGSGTRHILKHMTLPVLMSH